MSISPQLGLAERLAAISLATDLGRGLPNEKALRTTLVAARLAEELDLDHRARSDTFYAALIHPVGCTAFTYEGARLAGTSELKSIPAYMRADTERVREGLRAMREEVRREPFGRAARGVLKGITVGRGFLDYVVRADCEAGTRFTKRIGLPRSVASVVLQVHERWDGKGLPARLVGEALETGARVIALADHVEIFHRLEGREETRAMLRRRAGGWFDRGSWGTREVWRSWQRRPPAGSVSERTRRPRSGVLGSSTTSAASVSRTRLGQDRPAHRGGVEQVRLHAYHTERVLARSPVLEPLAQLAGMHHERMDGSGYQRGATPAAIPIGARVLAAADVFHAQPHGPHLREAGRVDEGRRWTGAAETAVETHPSTHSPPDLEYPQPCPLRGLASRDAGPICRGFSEALRRTRTVDPLLPILGLGREAWARRPVACGRRLDHGRQDELSPSRKWVRARMAQCLPARDSGWMTHWRLARERARDAATARPSLADCTLALWLVAAFLGGFVASHYLLARVLLGGAEAASAIPAGGLLL